MSKKILYTHESVINSFSHRDIKALAIYLYAKKRIKNSTIYNWNYKTIAEYLGISYHKSYKYIKILKERGFAYEHKDNLVFKSMYKVIKDNAQSTRGTKSINIQWCDTLQDIEDKLITFVIAEKINRQRHIIKLKSDIQLLEDDKKRFSYGRTKKLLNRKRKNPELTEKIEDYNIINCRKFSKDFNVSLSTANRILKRIESKEYVKRDKILEKVKNKGNDRIRRSGYCFFYKGDVYNYIGTNTTIYYNTIYNA